MFAYYHSTYPTGTLVRTSAPLSEPISLSEAKLFLRVDGTEEDGFIEDTIAAAREQAEQHMRRSLITQSWSLWLDGQVAGRVWLPMGPIQSVSGVRLHPKQGSSQTVDSSLYQLDGAGQRLCLHQHMQEAQIEIQYSAGYGAAEDIPPTIKQGLLLHVLALYERREGGRMPEHSLQLYASYRREMV